MEKISIDPVDRKILRSIQQNPDASLAQLGEMVGVSQSPCWRRLKRLQDLGVLRQRAWIFSGEKLDLGVCVVVDVRLVESDEGTRGAFENAAKDCPHIIGCFAMSGQSDYMLHVIVASVSDYDHFLKRVLSHLPGVGSMNSSFILNVVKHTHELPL